MTDSKVDYNTTMVNNVNYYFYANKIVQITE